jgi:formate C-acetyltransferase
MNYLNMLKPLEYALHQGNDGVTGKFSGTASPELTAYTTFDALFAEYKRQLRTLILTTAEVVNGFEGYLSEINPLSMLSGTFSSCIEKGRDALNGGARMNNSCMTLGYLADITDSLLMLKIYVDEKQEISLPEFVRLLDTNFADAEPFRRKLLADREKYGNNQPRPDAIAVELVDFIVDIINSLKNSRNGRWGCGFHVARMSYIQGKVTAATPNGRRFGEELSKNISASMGQNRAGATAAILSATKIDATKFTSDACLDLGLLPSSVSEEDGLEAMYGLLMTFVRRGGHAMQINVFNSQILRDAQEHPEKYQDLQIRVCGWNVLWNNIDKEEQDGFIRQAEALV